MPPSTTITSPANNLVNTPIMKDKDGSVELEYGQFKVSVPVKQGMTAQAFFDHVESKIVRQQNGAMSVQGGAYDGTRNSNPSVGFGIHMTRPFTPAEKRERAMWEK